LADSCGFYLDLLFTRKTNTSQKIRVFRVSIIVKRADKHLLKLNNSNAKVTVREWLGLEKKHSVILKLLEDFYKSFPASAKWLNFRARYFEDLAAKKLRDPTTSNRGV